MDRLLESIKRIPTIAIAILAIGAILRLVHYLGNRSLWLDEAMLAKHVLSKGCIELLIPLGDQAAPILFLLLSRLVVLVFGGSEYALRLISLLCGLASLPLFYLVAARILSRRFIPIACAVFSFSAVLTYYSQEFKQYAGDVAVALALSYLTLCVLDARERSNRFSWLLCVTGCISIFLSFPAVFVLAGNGTTLAFLKIRGLLSLSFTRLTIIAAVWGVCLSANYIFFVRPVYAINGISDYWRAGYLPLPLNVGAVKEWGSIGRSFLSYAGHNLFWHGFIVVLIAIALIAAAFNKSAPILMISTYFAFALFASLLGKFPFLDRQILFLIPFAILLSAKGLQTLSDERPIAVLAVLSLCFLAPSLNSLRFLATNWAQREEIKPLLTYLDARKKPDDQVYIYYGASPAVSYYHPNASYFLVWLHG